ncbi:hypothetical protein GN244_ATG19276 [Phytophthora infestans]|uniref:Uncharacterized protein n=1 Tax=Phytophthora infestans TaxID=4787 RepID=A0A833SQ30_PHYIN|nr:hypothetical protein GN244_ATG19276 [Phytophthora infestans]KAF4128084.1 hypothetical protein GN958_ATG22737 [Phytophthora infestans]
MTPMQQGSVLVITVVFLVMAVSAGYVDVYTDADYKGYVARTEDVRVGYCYVLCEDLNDTISSAKWDGLPEKTPTGDDAMISFYVDRDCKKHNIWWRTKTQSDDDLYFPSNFKLDRINDQISSFMVWSTKKVKGIATIQCIHEELGAKKVLEVGSYSNNTVGSVES